MKIMHLHSSQSKRAAVKEKKSKQLKWKSKCYCKSWDCEGKKITTEVINQTVIVCAVRAFSNFLG